MRFDLPKFNNDSRCYGLTVCGMLENPIEAVLKRFGTTATDDREMTAFYRPAAGTAFFRLHISNYHVHIDLGVRSALRTPPKRTHKRSEVEDVLRLLVNRSARVSIRSRFKASLKQLRRKNPNGMLLTLLKPVDRGDLTFYPSSLRTLVKKKEFVDLEWDLDGDDVLFTLRITPVKALIERDYLIGAYNLSQALFEFLALGRTESLISLEKEMA